MTECRRCDIPVSGPNLIVKPLCDTCTAILDRYAKRHIRLAMGPDLPELMRLLRYLCDDVPDNPEKMGEILRDRLQQKIKTYITISDTTIIATASVFFEPKFIHSGQSVAHIEDVCVHPDYRNLGLASEIVDHICRDAAEAGCYKAILDCKPTLVRVYEKAAFQATVIQMRRDLWRSM